MSPKHASFKGALTIDLEEYFHVSAFETHINQSDWPQFQSRVVESTNTLLELFSQHRAKATFFCLGVVAKEHPDLIQKIASHGHEIASHGWDHKRVHTLSRKEFTEDLLQSKKILEDITLQPVKGYRAPSFSIHPEKTPWAYDCLAEAGYSYSSSQHPIAHDHYGNVDGSRIPYYPQNSDVCEIPITTVRYGKRQLPCAGGGFFRVLPLFWFKHALKKANNQDVRTNFYLHPWEIDPNQPKINGLPAKTRLRHYSGLNRCAAKLDSLLETRQWMRMDQMYADILSS
jgi:polysaccharide deacetylase family protein (PEP-CTERM system associated)